MPRTGEGLSRLAAAVSDALTHHFVDVDVETDVANGRLLASLGEEHRDSKPHVYRRPRFGSLPHAAQVSWANSPPEEATIKLRRNGERCQNGMPTATATSSTERPRESPNRPIATTHLSTKSA